MIPFVNKYRPTTFDDILLNDTTLNTFKYFVDNKVLPNLLFYGPTGTGKTSAISIIARNIYKNDYGVMVQELNASDNRNIQVVRKNIKEFASTKTIFSYGFKLIILDEVDSMTYDAQFCLRRIMETYAENVRFCFICNYIGKIIPAIQSRCTKFKFIQPEIEPIKLKVNDILGLEGISLPDDFIHNIILNSNGDIRKILNIIQIFQLHEYDGNADKYYNILTIRNYKYCEDIYRRSFEVKDTDDFISFRNEIIDGIDKGYFSIIDLCYYFFYKSKKNISKLAEIERDNFMSSNRNLLIDKFIITVL